MTSESLCVAAGEDCEALVEQPNAVQNPSFRLSKYGLVVTMLATLLATCVVASWCRMGVESQTSSATLAIIGEATKWTKFGEVPLTLRLSGLDCPGGKFNEGANGQYIYQGQTADGRPYYRGPHDTGDDAWLYYDKECDGAKGGNYNQWGRFVLTWSKEGPSTHAASDLDANGNCGGVVANAIYASRRIRPDQVKGATPWMHSKAGALPEERVKWQVWCGSKPGHTVQTLTLEGGAKAAPKDLKAEGTWQYVTTVNAGETRTETYGFDKTNSNGGSWDASAEISGTVGGQVGLSFFAEAETSITSTARGSMQDAWNTAVGQGHKLKTEIPFQKGGALWQWQFHVKKHGHTMTIPANDFALTSNLAESPKCYPGLSLDGWDYQKCVLGGSLH